MHLPSCCCLSAAPYTCVVHMSLGRCQGLAGNVCLTAKHTCSLHPAKPFSCWLLGWVISTLQTPCLCSLSAEEISLSLSLSHFFSPTTFLHRSLAPSFPAFLFQLSFHFIKKKEKEKNQNLFAMLFAETCTRGLFYAKLCASGLHCPP